MTARRRAILLARLSDNRDDLDLTEEGIPQSLDDQVKRMRERADELGWDVYKVIMNPRLSAYKKRMVTLPNGERDYRVWRPDLREALADLASGRANGLLALDLDRAFRDHRDLQDLINVVEYSPHSIVVESATGSLHMEKGHDNFDAEIRVLVANKSSRDTARRVKAARERQANNGRFGGGRRPYGFKPDGVTVVPAEAAEIQAWAASVLAGVSLRALAVDLRTRGIPTAAGKQWSATTVRGILRRPRNAGHMVYKGQPVGKGKAPWKPILEDDVWQSVKAKLAENRSRVELGPNGKPRSPGAPHRWLGSGIYLCECGSTVLVQASTQKAAAYRCNERRKGVAHVVRNMAKVDGLVEQYVIEMLARPAALELLDVGPNAGVDVSALRNEVKVLRTRKEGLAAAFADGEIDRPQLKAGTKRIEEKLAAVENLLAPQTDQSPLNPMKEYLGQGYETASKGWRAMPLSTKRAIIRKLVTVTILANVRQGSVFDETSVVVRRNVRGGAS